MNPTESLPSEESFLLRQYLSILWRRKWSIALITLVGILGAVFYTKQQTPMYTSKITVLAADELSQINQRQSAPDMTAEQSLLYSLPVTQCTTIILNNPALNSLSAGPQVGTACSPDALSKVVVQQGLRKNLKVIVPQSSSILDINYTDPRPRMAQSVTQAFAIAYIHYKDSQAVQQLNALRAPYLNQLNTPKTGLIARLTQANQAVADALSAANPQQLTAATQERQQIEQQITEINFQLLDLAPSKLVHPQIVAPASLPTSPSSPKTTLNIAAGLFVALALGIGLAFLRERLDDSLRGRADLEERSGVPVLAVIPEVPRWKKKKQPRLVTQEEPKSTVSESYRSLRTSILFAAAQRGLTALVVTSPVPGEGKTTTAANLAVVLADAKKRVILLSADLRKPRLHQFFGVDNQVGLSNVLAGEVEPWKALRDPGVENLRIMPSGPVPARPGELLQSERMVELLGQLREVADFVIIDTPPVLLVADATAMAPYVDGVLLVADAQSTTRGAVTHVRDQLEQVDAPLFGTVLNNFDPAAARGYSYGGYYGYMSRYGYRYGYRYEDVADGADRRRGVAAPPAALTPPRPRGADTGGDES